VTIATSPGGGGGGGGGRGGCSLKQLQYEGVRPVTVEDEAHPDLIELQHKVLNLLLGHWILLQGRNMEQA